MGHMGHRTHPHGCTPPSPGLKRGWGPKYSHLVHQQNISCVVKKQRHTAKKCNTIANCAAQHSQESWSNRHSANTHAD